MTVPAIPVVVMCAMLSGARAQDRPAPPGGPETMDVQATVSAGDAGTGGLTVPVVLHIDRYTPDHARTTMTDALKYRGYPGFLQALREAPPAGWLEVGGRRIAIRWARQTPEATGRVITIVTDTPVYFIGGGKPGTKPATGYQVAVMRLTMDGSGRGTGTMAAAAKVKPHDVDGVQVDDYAAAPVTITAVVRRALK